LLGVLVGWWIIRTVAWARVANLVICCVWSFSVCDGRNTCNDLSSSFSDSLWMSCGVIGFEGFIPKVAQARTKLVGLVGIW
jgi:hypothetical protein